MENQNLDCPTGSSEGDAGGASRVDNLLDEGRRDKSAADFDQTAAQADAEERTLQPGQSPGGGSDQNNNGRGGGK